MARDRAWEGDIVEAPSMIRRGDAYYLFYSANWFNQPDSKFMALGDDLDTGFQDALDAGILQPYGITKLPFPSFEDNSYCGDSVSVGPPHHARHHARRSSGLLHRASRSAGL